MKNLSRLFAVSILILGIGVSGRAQQAKEPVDYVNPNIGGIGHLLTSTRPIVKLPAGMAEVSPITTPRVEDHYLADKIYGFPAGGFSFMPLVGPPETDPDKNASWYDHALETATPYYYKVTLDDTDTVVEYTVSARGILFRIEFPQNAQERHLLLAAPAGSELDLTDSTHLSGHGGRGRYPFFRGRSRYFYAEFSEPVASSRKLSDIRIPEGITGGSGIMADFKAGSAQQLEIRVGVSSISEEQARLNLQQEIPDWNFDQVRSRARTIWNRALSQIQVEGGTPAERSIFYTALYRVLIRSTNMAEDNKYVDPLDHKVHSADGHGFYPGGGGLWEAYSEVRPLLLILDPRMEMDFLRSFLLMYKETGNMMGLGRGAMIGHHVVSVFLDAYVKGYRDFDLAEAYQGLKKNAMDETFLPWPRRGTPFTSLDKFYVQNGYFPALAKGEKETNPWVNPIEHRQAVSVTLENAYDDWCTAQLAKALHNEDDFKYFMKRAHNYENVFDPQVGFMAPKAADGKWVLTPSEYSPIWSGGQGGRQYYTEENGWNYTFFVPQDVAGLIRLIGGREKFDAKLDRLFQDQFEGYHGNPHQTGASGSKYFFLGQFPDMTGLIGQYTQGDEPSWNIPYLYNYAGQPWKTQRRVREIMNVWYGAGPLGICGDDDSGEMSAWYVLSAMGFYPVTPGTPTYNIGSPIFKEIKIALTNGKTFTILAPGASTRNQYIQSAELNGKPWNKPWFDHSAIENGGTLTIHMGPLPNKTWGSAPEDAPPSMSKEP